MSPHLHSLKPGDTHSFFGVPIPGGAGWPTGKGERNIALIAGGAGITPLYQFTQAVFRDAAIQRPQGRTFELPQITLIFGVNTPADLLFHDEFRDLEKRYPDHFRCVYTVTDPEGKKLPSVQDSLLIRNYETGRITRELLEKWMPKPDAPGGVKILLCGPPGMEEAIAGKKDIGGILGDMGYQKPQLARM